MNLKDEMTLYWNLPQLNFSQTDQGLPEQALPAGPPSLQWADLRRVILAGRIYSQNVAKTGKN